MPSFMRMGRRHSDSGVFPACGDMCLASRHPMDQIAAQDRPSGHLSSAGERIVRSNSGFDDGLTDDDPLQHAKAQQAQTQVALAQANAVLSQPPKASGGLAARRGMAMGKIEKHKADLATQGNGKAGPDGPHKKRIIERIQDGHFVNLYKLGEEVMSSCHQGMEVLFAQRKSDGVQVVVKLRKRAISFSSGGEEREWRDTMELMLNLPPRESICRLFEVLEDTKYYYVVMEKVEGKDLFESQDHPGPWPIADAREVIKQLLEAVAHLHSEGYIHKDLKLENVMIDSPPGTPKKGSPKNSTAHPMDPNSFFGLAPATSGAGDESPKVKLIDFDTVEECTPQSPKAKVVLGSDQYIAPEAYSGRYSSASDMFAVGVIAYKLVAGRFPFPNRFFDDKPGENWVGSPKMKQIKQRLCNYNVDYTLPAFSKEPDALDFCRSLLDCDVSRRMEAPQALAHPFITRGATTSTPSKSMAFGSAPSIGSSSQNPFSIAAMARLFPRMAQS
eukprot:gnl/TRDRNA2_/TRDRNA2_175423_c6_seq42.p1 gnl/TRDRNA2_/TRDRNA2_175423_c6~~gnl/TRDRNA2_/TRDRNA2_175423_c6_seq42.p1  ORF type:complete len:538 (+),score=99.74 gnl/TRDRNA2_/TRDRNA2_175423_c6_seq42:113-1615(+)